MNPLDLFIKRPVATIILNALIIIVGVLAIKNLPVREYPEVTLPKFSIYYHFPNASAELMETEVATVVEEKLAGLENLELITSRSSTGITKVALSFKSGTDNNIAFIQIKDKLATIKRFLPKEIEEPTIHAGGEESGNFFFLSLDSKLYKTSELTHLANVHLANRLRSLPGVANLVVEGEAYIMKITLNREKLFEQDIPISLVAKALRENNVVLPAGKLNQDEPIQIDLALHTVNDFENIVIKKTDKGLIYLKDIADVKLSKDKKIMLRINGKPGVEIAIAPTPSANQLELSDEIRKLIPTLEKQLPPNIKLKVIWDSAEYIRDSVKSVQRAIFEAIFFVGLIILISLRSFKLSLIPLVSIPISLIGTIALMSLFGLSINTITLMAFVLAVGLVVDDAIVVLENVHRNIKKNVSVFKATQTATKEIGFAIVATTLTLASVYIPITFYSGTVGRLFKEFAITLSGSVIISGFVALTLTPVMCVKLLSKTRHKEQPIGKVTIYYQSTLNWLFKYKKSLLMLILFMTFGVILIYKNIPQALAPAEDRGVMGLNISPIANKDIAFLNKYIKQAENIAKNLPETDRFITYASEWGANILILLKPWDKRTRTSSEIQKALQKEADLIPSVDVFAWNMESNLPGIESFGEQRSIKASIRSLKSYEEMYKTGEKILAQIRKTPKFDHSYQDLNLDQVSYNAKLNKFALASLGLEPYDIAQTMEAMLYEFKPLSFRMNGIRYDVLLKTDKTIKDLDEIYMTNKNGKKVALSNVVSLQKTTLPSALRHKDQLRSSTLSFSLPDVTDFYNSFTEIQEYLDKNLPSGYSYDFSGDTKKFLDSSSDLIQLLLLALLFIYCILAIQFENFIDPFIILITVPLAAFGSLAAMWMFNITLNIFSQIGLITLIGLITKHGILIVDFVNKQLKENVPLQQAIINGTSLRMKPILMTTGTMVISVIPFIFSSGAGSEIRQTLGYVLAFGLIVGTFLTLTLFPISCWAVKKLQRK